MGDLSNLLLSFLIFLVAFLYSSVGHGGASGYLAVLSFLGLSSKEMSTTALILNVLVSLTAFLLFLHAKHFSWKLTLPFIITSVPASFIGGKIHIDEHSYSLLLAMVLLLAAIRLAMPLKEKTPIHPHAHTPILLYTIPAGACIGFISGVVGIGGGIFLSPLIILMNWADIKKTAATSAFFILVNSISGLLGRFAQGAIVINHFVPFIISAFIGGVLGSYLGAQKFSGGSLCKILALVLVIAAGKLVLKTL